MRASLRSPALRSITALTLAGVLLAGPPLTAAADPHRVGYRQTTLTYTGPAGAKRSRPLVIWYPTTAAERPHRYGALPGHAAVDAPCAPGRHPVVLFSHGYIGGKGQTVYLTEQLARRGYIVAAVDHADASSSEGWKRRAPNWIDSRAWTPDTFRDRRDDVVALLDHLVTQGADPASWLAGRVDAARVGAVGHSLGGYTVTGLVGGWKSWREPRIKAGLLLSPYLLPYLARKGSFERIDVPVMVQGGTFDWGITPFLPRAFRRLRTPRYYLVLKGGNHLEWTNLAARGKPARDAVRGGKAKLIFDYSVAFLDRAVRGQTEAERLKTAAPGLTRYERRGQD